MNIKVITGKYDVIDSGLVIADDWDSDIIFHVDAREDFKFDVILKFEENEDGKTGFFSEAREEENKLILKCVNFTNSTGTSSPLELATVSGKKIYLNFRNYGAKKIMRKIEYTFYMEK